MRAYVYMSNISFLQQGTASVAEPCDYAGCDCCICSARADEPRCWLRRETKRGWQAAVLHAELRHVVSRVCAGVLVFSPPQSFGGYCSIAVCVIYTQWAFPCHSNRLWYSFRMLLCVQFGTVLCSAETMLTPALHAHSVMLYAMTTGAFPFASASTDPDVALEEMCSNMRTRQWVHSAHQRYGRESWRNCISYIGHTHAFFCR